MQVGCLTLLLARLHGRAFAVALRIWQRLRWDVAVGLQGVAQLTLQVARPPPELRQRLPELPAGLRELLRPQYEKGHDEDHEDLHRAEGRHEAILPSGVAPPAGARLLADVGEHRFELPPLPHRCPEAPGFVDGTSYRDEQQEHHDEEETTPGDPQPHHVREVKGRAPQMWRCLVVARVERE